MPSRPPQFQPRFMLALLYLAAFFLVYALLFVAPELWAGWRELAPSDRPITPEDVAPTKEAVKRAVGRGRLLIAFLGALATVALGARLRLLPGLR
jgi:hypothetical protein